MMNFPNLLRNFGFSYNNKRPGFVRVNQTKKKKTTGSVYSKLWFNNVRNQIIKAGLAQVEKQFGITKLDQVPHSTTAGRNNTTLFLKTFIKDPSDIQYTHATFDETMFKWRYESCTYDKFLTGSILDEKLDPDTILPIIKQDLQAWWISTTEVL
jgi:hypothetical protein